MSFIIASLLVSLTMLILELTVFFGLSKLLSKKARSLSIIISFVIYQVSMFILMWIYYPKLDSYTAHTASLGMSLLRIISLAIVSGSIFLIISHLMKLFDWKKGLICFLIMNIIFIPAVVYLVEITISQPLLKNTNMNLPDIVGIMDLPSTRILERINQSVGGMLWYDVYLIKFSVSKY